MKSSKIIGSSCVDSLGFGAVSVIRAHCWYVCALILRPQHQLQIESENNHAEPEDLQEELVVPVAHWVQVPLNFDFGYELQLLMVLQVHQSRSLSKPESKL